MKKTLFVLLLLSPLLSLAQIDSASVKINVSIQARDAEYLASYASFREDYEEFFDASKAKFRVTTSPSGNTIVAIDGIPISAWLLIMSTLRSDYIAIQAGVFSRVDALLRAKNNAYLNRILDARLASDTQSYTNSRQEGRRRLRKAIN